MLRLFCRRSTKFLAVTLIFMCEGAFSKDPFVVIMPKLKLSTRFQDVYLFFVQSGSICQTRRDPNQIECSVEPGIGVLTP